MIGEILLWLAVAAAGTAVVWKGSGLLESSSTKLSAYYRLPPVVHGAIVVAVGSSFPELSTTVISALVHGQFQLGVAAIVGSAIFNILVIPALCGLFSPKPLEANRELVYKEAQFYMVSVAVLLVTFSFAVIYFPKSSESAGIITGEMNRLLALIPIGLYLLYVFVQFLESRESPTEEPEEKIAPGRQWLLFLGSLLIIVAGVEGLVRSAINLGEIFDTPSFLWGFTVVAAGTSVPDAFVSVRAARKNNGVTALANVLGSNVFDLLVAIPAGVLVAGATVINFSVAAPMMGLLTIATIALFLLMRTSMVLTRTESVILLVLYTAMVAWVTLESIGIVNLLSGLLQTASG
ncbi:sodium:calcium antiporter [Jiella marina]|uniref:sodium:calcium antiporter n=1 Tax=Jiella sp. LLJ827 TaxID=2917712 RepID=UPI0021009D05|nr:sodium:calcium antiporter [Jiella sp. LLJ827]MCQ0986238.1 sodium:calcium antiporter [Jiella sp. LLJ827]